MYSLLFLPPKSCLCKSQNFLSFNELLHPNIWRHLMSLTEPWKDKLHVNNITFSRTGLYWEILERKKLQKILSLNPQLVGKIFLGCFFFHRLFINQKWWHLQIYIINVGYTVECLIHIRSLTVHDIFFSSAHLCVCPSVCNINTVDYYFRHSYNGSRQMA